jgi:hypothetical protein
MVDSIGIKNKNPKLSIYDDFWNDMPRKGHDSVEQVAEKECRKIFDVCYPEQKGNYGRVVTVFGLACFEAGEKAGYDEAKNQKEFHCPVTKADLESERYKKGFEEGRKQGFRDGVNNTIAVNEAVGKIIVLPKDYKKGVLK